MTGPSPQLPRQAQGAGSSSRPPWVPDGAAPASGSGSLRRTGQRHRPPEAADDAARPPWYGAASGCPGTGGPCGKVSFPVVGSGFYLAGPSLPRGRAAGSRAPTRSSVIAGQRMSRLNSFMQERSLVMPRQGVSDRSSSQVCRIGKRRWDQATGNFNPV